MLVAVLSVLCKGKAYSIIIIVEKSDQRPRYAISLICRSGGHGFDLASERIWKIDLDSSV